MSASSWFSTSLSAFGGVSAPDLEFCNRCEVAHHCCFNLHFLYDTWCGTFFFFFFFFCCLCSSFAEVPVKVSGSFSKQVVLSVLSFKSSLCILNNSLLSDVSLENIFSQSAASLLILLTSIFQRGEVFIFKEVQLINYFICRLFLRHCTWKSITIPNVIQVFSYVIL